MVRVTRDVQSLTICEIDLIERDAGRRSCRTQNVGNDGEPGWRIHTLQAGGDERRREKQHEGKSVVFAVVHDRRKQFRDQQQQQLGTEQQYPTIGTIRQCTAEQSEGERRQTAAGTDQGDEDEPDVRRRNCLHPEYLCDKLQRHQHLPDGKADQQVSEVAVVQRR